MRFVDCNKDLCEARAVPAIHHMIFFMCKQNIGTNCNLPFWAPCIFGRKYRLQLTRIVMALDKNIAYVAEQTILHIQHAFIVQISLDIVNNIRTQ